MRIHIVRDESKAINTFIDILTALLAAIFIFLMVGKWEVAGIFFLAVLLNVLGIPLLFVYPLPWWVIYIIVVWWLLDLLIHSKREVDKNDD